MAAKSKKASHTHTRRARPKPSATHDARIKELEAAVAARDLLVSALASEVEAHRRMIVSQEQSLHGAVAERGQLREDLQKLRLNLEYADSNLSAAQEEIAGLQGESRGMMRAYEHVFAIIATSRLINPFLGSPGYRPEDDSE